MARWRVLAAIVPLVVAASCGDDDAGSATTSSDARVVAVASTVHAAATSAPVATSAPDTPTATTQPPPPSATTVPRPAPATAPLTAVPESSLGVADPIEVREIGRSVSDRPITAVSRGTPGGTRVLVVGVIHGDEDDGVAIIERLATASVPEGVELWLVETMNPDGQAAGQRGNANGVDLNRNFPHEWGPIGQPGDGQYAGTGPASEPETQAVVRFVDELGPALVLWYHQDLFRLSPGEGFEGAVKARYAEITGLPIERITGGTYTGVAATWARTSTGAISFIVELGGSLTPEEADLHALAVLDVAAMVAVE
jgi:protein MpaA